MPSTYSTCRYSGAVRALPSASAAALPRPVTCRVWMPAAASAGRAAVTAALMLAAPEEPPVTTRVGRSCSRPRAARASCRAALSVQPGDFRAHGHTNPAGAGQLGLFEGYAHDGGALGARPGWRARDGHWPRAQQRGSGACGQPGTREWRHSRPLPQRRRPRLRRGSSPACRTARARRAGSRARSPLGFRGMGTRSITASS